MVDEARERSDTPEEEWGAVLLLQEEDFRRGGKEPYLPQK